jgi:hypothetical protein
MLGTFSQMASDIVHASPEEISVRGALVIAKALKSYGWKKTNRGFVELDWGRIEMVLTHHVVTQWTQHQWICRACFTPEDPFVEWPERHHAKLIMALIEKEISQCAD